MFYFILTLILMAIGLLYYLTAKPKQTCPNCGAKSHQYKHQEVLDVMPVEAPQGEGGGMMLQKTIKEAYKCRQCGHRWTHTYREI